MAQQVGLKQNVAFVGGVAKNAGIKAALEKELGISLRATRTANYRSNRSSIVWH